MKEILYVHKTKIMMGTLGVLAAFVFLFVHYLSSPEIPLTQATLEIEGVMGEKIIENENAEMEEVATMEELPAPILIDIKGAVRTPGVYELQSHNRVIDAVEKAGGFLETADTRKVNLASLLVDEMVIYVPEEGEEMPQLVHVEAASNGQQSAEGGSININTATEEELMKISGVGPAKAKAIVAYRTDNGLFKTIDEIVNVSGIGQKSFEKIKNEITTSN